MRLTYERDEAVSSITIHMSPHIRALRGDLEHHDTSGGSGNGKGGGKGPSDGSGDGKGGGKGPGKGRILQVTPTSATELDDAQIDATFAEMGAYVATAREAATGPESTATGPESIDGSAVSTAHEQSLSFAGTETVAYEADIPSWRQTQTERL